MHLPEQAEVIRIFIGEADKHNGKPLYEVIVSEARRRGMAGATVLRGIMGFGANSHLHTSKILRLSEDLPIVIEIIDHPESIQEFLPWLDEVVDDGMVVIEDVRVIAYRHRNGKT